MTLFGKLKDLGIYRYRGKRAGRYRSLHSESNQHSSFNNTRLCMTGHKKLHLHNDVNISRSYRVAVLPSVLLCNVRAIANKIDELECVCNLNSADVVCVTETWLTDTIPHSAVSMKNYVLFRRDRPTHPGGIAAYINCDIPCQIVSTPTLDRFHLSPFPPETPDTQDTSAWEATVNPPSAEKRILLSIFRLAHRKVIYKAKRK